jgi:outer membrane protein, heavy metal efflux system
MNFSRIHLSAFFAILLAGSSSLAAESETAISRDRAIALAFENNRELKMAQLEIKRAQSRRQWSGRLENPELEVSANGDGIGLDEGESNYEVAFSQRFPLTAKLKHEKSLRSYQVILADAEIAERRRELAGEVDQLLVELLATREKIRLGRESSALNGKIVDFLQEKSKVGEASRLDVIQATLSGRTLDQEMKLAAAQERQQEMALKQLIGLDATSELTPGGSLKLPGARPSNKADLDAILHRRPDYIISLAKTDEAQAAVILEEAKRWDDISVKVFVDGENANDNPTGLERNTFAGVGVSIPLPFWKRNQEGIAQAKIDEEAASQGIEAAQFHIRSECEGAFQRRFDAWELAQESSGELLSLAEENLAGFRESYERGEATLNQVQKAQEQVLELQTAAVTFLADYHLAEAHVRFVTGAYPGLTSSRNDK